MKRFFKWGIATLVCGMILLFNPINVHAETYYWADATEMTEGGEIVKIPGWYKYAGPSSPVSEKMEAAPENLTSNDTIIIQCEPDEACKQWLQSLSGALGIKISSSYKGDIQIGSADATERLQLAELGINNAKNIVVYADIIDLKPRSLDTLIVHGNVTGTLCLGDLSTSKEESDIHITGNVEAIKWYKGAVIFDTVLNADAEKGYAGTITVVGTVNGGTIYDSYEEEAIGYKIWRQIGTIGACEAGIFQMTTGELAETVPATYIELQPGNYRFQYMITNNGACTKSVSDAETGEGLGNFPGNVSDISDGDSVIIKATTPGETTVIRANLNRLNISVQRRQEINVTVEGTVKNLYVNSSLYDDKTDVRIEGDVGLASIIERPGADCNVFVNGTVTNGRTNPSVGVYELSQFTCSNMLIMENGELGSGIFLKKTLEEGSFGYQPLKKQEKNAILSEEESTTEITVTTQTGNKTIVKAVGVDVAETEQDALTNLKAEENLQNALDQVQEDAGTEETAYVAEAIGALEINVNTYYEEKTTGTVYADDPQYGTQEITNLSDGKTLPFTVQVAAEDYEEQAKYTVIRKHTNADGSISMDALETTQKGDILVFSSDKFSTFVIVEMKEEVNSSEPEEPSEPAEPSEPEEPSEPAEPSEPQQPSGPQEPSEPQQPSEPQEPSEPQQPSEPQEPSEPEKPSEPEEPSESEKADESNDVVEEDNVQDDATVEFEQTTIVEATETGDSGAYTLWCSMLFFTMLGLISLKKKEI